MTLSAFESSNLYKTADKANELSVTELIQSVTDCSDKTAAKIAKLFCSDKADGLRGLAAASPQELQGCGMTDAQVRRLKGAFELSRRHKLPRGTDRNTVIDDPAVAASVLSEFLMWQSQEHFAVLSLNIKHQLIAVDVISKGTYTECLVDPKIVFSTALRRGATRILVAHNHPSGDLEPSAADIQLTKDLQKAGAVINLPVLDHLILGNGEYKSIRQTVGGIDW